MVIHLNAIFESLELIETKDGSITHKLPAVTIWHYSDWQYNNPDEGEDFSYCCIRKQNITNPIKVKNTLNKELFNATITNLETTEDKEKECKHGKYYSCDVKLEEIKKS